MYALEQRPISNRTRVEILASILKVAGEQTLKTHIMYKANLSYRQLEKYLDFLETRGLIARTFEDNVILFHVTEKGLEFLKDYARISSYFD
ncbi:MAG: winged helix-turn-helix domain-containing protein [Candidatus Bathyarchaeia archaeon]|jgi:predicted transcriptional regulator